MTGSNILDYEVRDHVVVITLSRPGSLNALNLQLRHELDAAMVEFNRDDGLRVAILVGAGRAFSTGADLREMSTMIESGALAQASGRLSESSDAPMREVVGFAELERSRKPVIAAIDGYCLGGGFELALHCDIRIATRRSQFGLPEPRRSILAGAALVHLSRMIPLGEALRMQLTGSPITADRAHRIGLVQEVVDCREELLEYSQQIAGEIVQCAPLAVQYIKKVVRGGRDLTVDEQWQLAEAHTSLIQLTEDAREGPMAFAEKREPVWKMR